MPGDQDTSSIPAPPIAAEPLTLSYASLAADIAPEPTSENVRLLQHAADYYSAIARIGMQSIFILIGGALMFAGGLAGYGNSIPREYLLVAGPILVVYGMVSRWNPNRLIKHTDLIELVIAGSFLVAMFLRAAQRNRLGDMITPLVLAAVIGARSVPTMRRRHRKLLAAIEMNPSPAMLASVESMVKRLRTGEPISDRSLLEFSTDTWVTPIRWKGLLLSDVMLIEQRQSSELLFASRSEIEMISWRDSLYDKRNAKKRHVLLQFGDRKLKLVMFSSSFIRLYQWLNDASKPSITEESTCEPA